MQQPELVILVNENDQEIGTMEKMQAHRLGLLHRAFSVFIFNDKNELLLQQRALTKYHSGGLWTNTCCSHQRPNEDTLKAAHRRLKEEMGLECELVIETSFVYKTYFDNGLIEHEFDYVLFGKSNAKPITDSKEVENYKWIAIDDIKIDILKNPLLYTSWFKLAIKKLF